MTLFILLSTLSLLSALTVIFIKNPIYSLLSLIFCFFTIAGHYLLLNASFLAVVHIIVYAGAIMVLFLFMMMLMNLNGNTEKTKPILFKVFAVLATGLLCLSLIFYILKTSSLISTNPEHIEGSVETLGALLFTEYAIPFELTTVLFLAAVIGVVMLGKRSKGDSNS